MSKYVGESEKAIREVFRKARQASPAIGATKTKIVYGANLNFNLATEYLDFLLERGLVRTDNSRYEITGEGKTFLKKAKELQI